MDRASALVGLASTLALAGCCDSGVLSQGSSSGTSTGGTATASASGAGSTGNATGAAAGSSTTGTSGSTSSGGPSDGGRCDQAFLTWTGPTIDTDGSCLTDLQSFVVVWGLADAGPFSESNSYPGAIDVGLPCTAGATVSCGDGGEVVQLECAFVLGGLADGVTDFAVEAVSLTGTSDPSAPASKTIACGAGVGSPCSHASDCPPYLMCDPDAGKCDYDCQAGCLCDADSQCMAAWQTGGLGEGWTCLDGVCGSGCTSATDCGFGSCCDLTSGSPGTCILPPAMPTAQCLCAIDGQCNQVQGSTFVGQGPGVEPAYGNICSGADLCVAGCKNGVDCPTGSACDLSKGFPGTCVAPCEGDQCSCVEASQCTYGPGLGTTCNLTTGLCGPGCATASDCGADEACDTTTGTCSATCGVSDHPYACDCLSNSQCTGGVASATTTCSVSCTSDAGNCGEGSCSG